jgi:DNA-binding transcriptional regulator of glucitol operon
MRVVFAPGRRLLSVIASAVVLLVLAGCGNSSIVGKWRMSGAENQTVWEFSSNGSVLVGEVRGRYKFGDQDRIKIQTPFSTTVYQAKISADQLVLQEPGGSKLEFTRIREAQR